MTMIMLHWLLLQCFVYITLVPLSLATPKCGLYGAPPCQYVPAAPGMTPACAGPGRTYCEKIDQYPIHIIKQLFSKWGYNIYHLLADETGEEFESVRRRLTKQPQFIGPIFPLTTKQPIDEGYKYPNPNAHGYTYRIPANSFDLPTSVYNEHYPEAIFIPTPFSNQRYQGYSQTNKGYSGTQDFYQNNGNAGHNQNSDFYIEQQHIAEYNGANSFGRYSRSIGKGENFTKSIVGKIMQQKDKLKMSLRSEANHTINHQRKKRQSFGRESLCQTNTQFIAPQAALNSRGNWMYVVNHMETGRQLVKTETCASSTCSNLCQLPNGYNSRCEQKYVQKRLIALHNNGQHVYTDTFWFPSCCVCTISNQ